MAGEPTEDSCSVKHLQSRVRSFASDPLHSAAYLSHLTSYLTGGYSKSNRAAKYNVPRSQQPEYNFLYHYKAHGTLRPEPDVFANVTNFTASKSESDYPEIAFATGYPSKEWLNAVVDRFGVDHRFLHNHLDFLPNSQRDWYINPDVPSRRQHSISLLIPSIVFTGTEGRRISVEELHQARNACTAHLRNKAKNFFGGTATYPGQSIVRQIHIHSGDIMVLEQAVSITILRKSRNVKILIWSDAGEDQDVIPATNSSRFQYVSEALEFCPVFFEKELYQQHGSQDEDQAKREHDSKSRRTRQPLSVLPIRYGETIDWEQASNDPLLMLQELFHFQASATAQYLNMLRKLTTETIARTPPTGNTLPSMDDILHFEYTKNILGRWCAHLQTLIETFDDGQLSAPALGIENASEIHERTRHVLRKDLVYLKDEAISLIGLCESGKSTIISSFTVFESKQAAAESRLVTQLTKATNRITFIFLPISFVTSVFGMNFKQFGQGPLSINLWVMVALPLLAVCIFLNEWGSQCVRYFRKFER